MNTRKDSAENLEQEAKAPEEALDGEADVEAEEQPDAEAEELSEQERLQQAYDELNDKYLRLMAEYDNYRKRSQKERDEIYPNATAAAIKKFLPVLDNFERAAAYDHPDDEFGKGFDMIYQSFREILEGLGVTPIGEVGEPFHPDLHNAVMHIEDENFGENVVSQVLQKGYKIGDKIIRYAMVQTAN